MKIGYATWGMPSMPIDAALAHVAAVGFDGVEIAVTPAFTTALDTLDASERRRVRGLLDRHDLDLSAVAGHQSLAAPDPAVHAENWRRLSGTADLCVDWAGPDGPPPLVTVLGTKPGDWEERRDFVLERVGALVEYCAARQVILALEAHVGDGMTDPAQVAALVEAVDSPHLKLNFDISHFEVEGVPTAETVRQLAPHAVHTHVKDQRGRAPDFDFLIPGEGDFDYAAYLGEMSKAGYEGYVTAEVSMQVHRRPDYDPLAAAEMCYRTLERAFAESGTPRP